MAYQHRIPSTYDKEWILNQLNSVSSYGFTEDTETNETIISHDGNVDDFEAMVDVISSYPTVYAREVLEPLLLERATSTRWDKLQTVEFYGKTIPADDTTLTKLTSAVVIMNEDPTSPQSVRWKTGPNAEDWLTLDKATLVAMGAAIRDHTQLCFNNEEALHIAIRAAANVEEMEAIDLEAGWVVE